MRRRALDKLLDIYLDLEPDRRDAFLSECRRRYPRLSRWFAHLAGESRTTVSMLTRTPEAMAEEALENLAFGDAPDLEPGTRLGPWRVIEPVGVGGMGKVYRGARADGAFDMDVAVKFIASRRPGLSEQLIRECRLLARLDHPAVTRLVDAGLTDEDEPYLVMEWVEGVDLDQWLVDEKPDLENRLQVFGEVTGAVAHAHQRLIVHGDIKPGNIRIRHDDQVKLMDFGVASLMTESNGDGERYAAMTPAFAAPEQLNRDPVTTHTDVWSLGALLYAMLTERSPTRENRRFMRDELSRYGRGRELAAIVDKACAGDPEQRYESAQALAEDIRRYRRDEPLLAAPPSGPVRVFKYARRKKLLFGSLTGTAVALLAGVSISTLLYLQAESERERAERHARQLEQVVQFQDEQLANIDTTMMGVHLREGIFDERRSVLEDAGRTGQDIEQSLEALEQSLVGVNFTNVALEWLDASILDGAVAGIERQFSGQPLIKARLLQSVASTMRHLALYEKATPLQDEALEIRRRELGSDHPQTLASLSNKGVLLREQGKLAEAESYTRRALESRRRVLGDDHPDTLHSISNMGVLLARQGNLKEAEPFYWEALERRRRVLGDDHPDTLTSISNTGVLLVRQGKLSEGEKYMRETLEGRRKALGNDDRATLQSINNLGVVLSRQEKLAEAEPYYREALERSKRVRGDSHPYTLDAVNNMGALLYRKEAFTEAEPYFREALEGSRRVLGDDHPSTIDSIHNMGRVQRELGNLDEAEALGAEALRSARRVLSSDHWLTAAYAVSYANTLAQMENFEEAEALMLEAHAVFVESLGEDHHRTIDMMDDLAEVYRAWHEAVPDGGYDQHRSEWLARVDAVKVEAGVTDE